MNRLVELGKQGIAFARQGYQTQTEFIFTKLNDYKTRNDRRSNEECKRGSRKIRQGFKQYLGKNKTSQPRTIFNRQRDNNTPYIKKVRVVSTIEYYLSD